MPVIEQIQNKYGSHTRRFKRTQWYEQKLFADDPKSWSFLPGASTSGARCARLPRGTHGRAPPAAGTHPATCRTTTSVGALTAAPPGRRRRRGTGGHFLSTWPTGGHRRVILSTTFAAWAGRSTGRAAGRRCHPRRWPVCVPCLRYVYMRGG